jgi:hypothetical protein
MSEQKGIGDQLEQYRQKVMRSDAVRTIQERINAQGPDLIEKVKALAGEAMVRRIAIQQDGRTLFELPLAVGLGGALLAPQLAAIGAIAALITNCTITVEREDTGGSPEAGRPSGSASEARGSSGEPVTAGNRAGASGSSGSGMTGSSGSSGGSSTGGGSGSSAGGSGAYGSSSTGTGSGPGSSSGNHGSSSGLSPGGGSSGSTER